jgi:thiol-disulfide isomerase/thioredoxin
MQFGWRALHAAWLAIAVACLGFACPAEAGDRATPVRLDAGMQAPQFSRVDLAGNKVDLSALRGNVVLIDFWASWCAPCIIEIPRLINLQKRYRAEGLRIIGVSMDDSAAPVKSLERRFAFNYPLILGDAKFGTLYGGILGLPVRILVSRDGKILHIWNGEVPADAIEKAAKTALDRN